MEPIELNRATPELNDQLDFLIRREFYVTYKKYQRYPFYLLGLTIIVFALSTLTDSESLIILKGVSIMLTFLTWIVAFIFLFTILLKRYQRYIWKRQYLKGAYLADMKFRLSFDEEKLCFAANDFNSEIKWSYYKYYAIHKDSIFIFPENNIYESIYYSKSELGHENYKLLKVIVSKKLIQLENKSWI